MAVPFWMEVDDGIGQTIPRWGGNCRRVTTLLMMAPMTLGL